MTKRRKQRVRECYIVGDECHIPLADGTVARVSKSDKDLVDSWNWAGSHTAPNKLTYYVSTNRPTDRVDSKGRAIYDTLYLHRHIMSQYESVDGLDIDHLDHDGRNNTRDNLRAVTRSVNSLNRIKLQATNTSGYKGVHHRTADDTWTANIRLKTGQLKHVIQTTDKKEAARLRDIALLREHADTLLQTSLNFPEKLAEYQTIISSSNP